jgi:RimJ/RimL family protein N-acetyltransferase
MNARLIAISELDELIKKKMNVLVATRRRDSLEAFLKEWDRQYPNHFAYAVFDDSIPSPVGLVVCDGGLVLGVEPSWWIAPEYEGKGYGSCAGKLLAEEAFRLGYRRRSLIHYDTLDYSKSRRIGEHFVRRFEELLRKSDA